MVQANPPPQGCTRARIAFVDPGSFTLPYDRAFISRLARDFDVDFYCSRTKYNPEELERAKELIGVRVSTYDISGTVSRRMKGMKEYLRLLADLHRNKNEYLAIHFNWALIAGCDQYLLPFLFRKRLVLTVHNAAPHGHQGPHEPTRRLAFHAKTVIFPSAATQQQFFRLYGVQRNYCTVLPHGTLAFGTVKQSASVSQDREAASQRRLVFFGNVKPYKGIETLASAAHLLKSKGIHVSVYGKWDASLSLIKEHFPQGSTIVDKFLSQSESVELFNSGAIFCLPYENASQSGVLYNLLHYSTPFISSSVGDTRDFLESHGLSNLLFKPGNADELCKAAEQAFEEKVRIVELLRNARSQHNWEFSSEDLNAAYRLGTPSPR